LTVTFDGCANSGTLSPVGVTTPYSLGITSSEVTKTGTVSHNAATGLSSYCAIVYSASVAGTTLTTISTPVAYNPSTKTVTIVSTQALVVAGTPIVIDIKAENQLYPSISSTK
jgi:hypothetical protein